MEREADAAGARRARILVVDDEPDVRSVLAEALAEEGHETRSCASAAAALAELGAGTWDLVLSDIRMPGGDGFSLLRSIRTSHPGTPVVLMTAQESREEARIAGADGYLQKPVSFGDLQACIARVLRLT